MKRFYAFTLALLLILCTACSALAFEMGPYASEYYSNASVAFNKNGMAVFSATTTFQFSKLSVTSCTLQIKSGRDWEDASTLTPPSKVSENRFTYDAEKSYASSCASGNTYRIKATFDADGHTITKYSGEAKF